MIERHQITARIKACGKCPEHIIPIAHIDVWIDGDDKLGVAKLRQYRPKPHHDPPRLSRISLVDCHHHCTIRTCGRWQPEICNLGKLLAHYRHKQLVHHLAEF